jgi:hypothetical protein
MVAALSRLTHFTFRCVLIHSTKFPSWYERSTLLPAQCFSRRLGLQVHIHFFNTRPSTRPSTAHRSAFSKSFSSYIITFTIGRLLGSQVRIAVLNARPNHSQHNVAFSRIRLSYIITFTVLSHCLRRSTEISTAHRRVFSQCLAFTLSPSPFSLRAH